MMKKINKTLIIFGVFGLLISLVQGIGLAEAKDPDYPTKPITCYIHTGAGGTTDSMVRPLLEATGKALGQPFVCVNKPGSVGALTAVTVMNAKPDGYTLGTSASSAMFVMPYKEDCPYKDLSGFTFIMSFSRHVLPVITRSDAPFKTWKELIGWARQHPKRAVKIGIPGSKSQSPFLLEVEEKEKVEFGVVVFPGSAESLTALLGGHITVDATGLTPQLIQYIEEGKLRIIAYSSKGKIPGYEDIPSFYELYGIEFSTPIGIIGPKGLPNYMLEKLDVAFAKGVKDANFINLMKRMYSPIVYMNRAEFNKEVNEAFPKYGDMLKRVQAEEAKEKK